MDEFDRFVEAEYLRCNSSGVIDNQRKATILRCLHDSKSVDRKVRHYVKSKGFRLLDVPSLGLKAVLVIPVKDSEKVYKPLIRGVLL